MNNDLGKTIRDENDRLCQIAEKEVDKYWRDACDKFKFLGIVLDHIKSQIQIGRSNINSTLSIYIKIAEEQKKFYLG